MKTKFVLILDFKLLPCFECYMPSSGKFPGIRCQGITQKKAYNIHNTAKVWNREYFASMGRTLQDTFDCSKNSESRYKIQMPGNYPDESI